MDEEFSMLKLIITIIFIMMQYQWIKNRAINKLFTEKNSKLMPVWLQNVVLLLNLHKKYITRFINTKKDQ